MAVSRMRRTTGCVICSACIVIRSLCPSTPRRPAALPPLLIAARCGGGQRLQMPHMMREEEDGGRDGQNTDRHRKGHRTVLSRALLLQLADWPTATLSGSLHSYACFILHSSSSSGRSRKEAAFIHRRTHLQSAMSSVLPSSIPPAATMPHPPPSSDDEEAAYEESTLRVLKACAADCGWWCRECSGLLWLDEVMDITYDEVQRLKRISFASCGEWMVPCFACNRDGAVVSEQYEEYSRLPHFWRGFDPRKPIPALDCEGWQWLSPESADQLYHRCPWWSEIATPSASRGRWSISTKWQR